MLSSVLKNKSIFSFIILHVFLAFDCLSKSIVKIILIDNNDIKIWKLLKYELPLFF